MSEASWEEHAENHLDPALLLVRMISFKQLRINRAVQSCPINRFSAFGVNGAYVGLSKADVNSSGVPAEVPRQQFAAVIEECVAMRRAGRVVDVVSGCQEISLAGECEGNDAVDDKERLMQGAVLMRWKGCSLCTGKSVVGGLLSKLVRASNNRGKMGAKNVAKPSPESSLYRD
jgi:hypothetical protein